MLLTRQISIDVSHAAPQLSCLKFISTALQDHCSLLLRFLKLPLDLEPEEPDTGLAPQEGRGGEHFAKAQGTNQQMKSWENRNTPAIQGLSGVGLHP